MISCATRRQVIQIPVELSNTSYTYDSKIDRIIFIDSVSRWTQNDTVYIYRERLKYINLADTLITRDSVPNAVKLENSDEFNVDYLKQLGDLKNLILKAMSPI